MLSRVCGEQFAESKLPKQSKRYVKTKIGRKIEPGSKLGAKLSGKNGQKYIYFANEIGMDSAGLRLICINSTSFKPWCWSQRSIHTSPLVEPKKRNRNQSWLLQHLETGRRPYKQARNMSKQVAHWISGSSSILFINLHHRDQGSTWEWCSKRSSRSRRRGCTTASSSPSSVALGPEAGPESRIRSPIRKK